MTAPATSFLGELVEGFALALAEAGIGLTYNTGQTYTAQQTGITAMRLPTSPARVVALTPYMLGDDPTQPMSLAGLQVRSRSGSEDPFDMFALDDSIADVLLGNYPMVLPNGVHISTITRTSAASMGMDQSSRWEWASNYRLDVFRRSPHRL